MIIGIGTDLIDIRRIEKTLATFGERFVKRVFTEIERERSENRAERAASYAKRFAAKEACSKALGSGIRMGVNWREMGVVNLPTGQPTMALTGSAAARLASMTPPGCVARIDLTITDDFPLAQAFVVMSAWPEGWPEAFVRRP
jgi:holo-[acyl-carrier protein] synthase